MRERILHHLDRLIGIDSTNPPRRMAIDHEIVTTAAAALEHAGLDVTIDDHGDGCLNILALRHGGSKTLVNCHLDTVPADPGWTRNPFALEIDGDLAYGLGTCDVKGAAACMIAALESTDGPATILFTTDEEAGQSTCVHSFLRDRPLAAKTVERVIVAEPTMSEPVTRHRGLFSGEVEFIGAAGHGSSAGARRTSALHHAVAWSARASGGVSAPELDAALDDLCVNIGVVHGGTKANVAASSAKVVFGLRPPATIPIEAAVARLQALAPTEARCTWTTRFAGPGLAPVATLAPGRTDPKADAAHTRQVIDELLEELERPEAPAVDFWTEAALFAAGGYPAVVLGPGAIDQAHTADEFVALEQLDRAAEAYRRLFTKD